MDTLAIKILLARYIDNVNTHASSSCKHLFKHTCEF